MNADGSGQRRLTNNTAGDGTPVWSPDGHRLAFWSNRDGDTEIFVMNADGSGQMQLTRNSGYDVSPTWSPDGQRLAFESVREGEDVEIFVNECRRQRPHAIDAQCSSRPRSRLVAGPRLSVGSGATRVGADGSREEQPPAGWRSGSTRQSPGGRPGESSEGSRCGPQSVARRG